VNEIYCQFSFFLYSTAEMKGIKLTKVESKLNVIDSVESSIALVNSAFNNMQITG